MTEFTPLMSFAGGLLIGLSALLLMLTWGRIAGMTAIIGGILPPLGSDWNWKAAFLAGAILAPLALTIGGYEVEYSAPVSTTALIIGGLIAATILTLLVLPAIARVVLGRKEAGEQDAEAGAQPIELPAQ